MSVGKMVSFWAQWHPDEVAISFENRNLTWRELDLRAGAFAGTLGNLGVQKGERVGLFMNNRIEFVEVLVACMYTGAICVPLNTRLTESEVATQVSKSSCTVIVTDTDLISRIEQTQQVSPDLNVIVAGEEVGGAFAYEAMVESGHKERALAEMHSADAPLFICFTSGTTGLPKGVVTTHGSWSESLTMRCLAHSIGGADTVIMPFSLAPAGGLNMAMIALWAGCRLIIEPEFDPGVCLKRIQDEAATVLMAPNVFHERMAEHESFPSADLSSLRVVLTGGSPVTEKLLKTYQQRGIPMTETMGMTEASAQGLTIPPAFAKEKLGSAGIPGPWMEVKLTDPQGNEVDRGGVGEIRLRAKSIMVGYWENPEANEEVLVDGWYLTGDLGVMDEDGFISVVGRAKDMIISGGYNIYPAEIENILADIDGVLEVAVVGVPDEKWGETPVVFAKSEPSVSISTINQALAGKISRYKIPQYAILGEIDLPRNISGKVVKAELTRQFLEIEDPSVYSLKQES